MDTVRLSTVRQLVQDSNLPEDEKKDFVKAAEREAAIPNTTVYRMVVFFLGLAIFIPLVPVLMRDSATAQMLLPIATGALGALAGLLAPSPDRTG